MLDAASRAKIRHAFEAGTLTTRSVSPSGEVAWKPVLAVHRTATAVEKILSVTTAQGSSVLTGGHRVFTTPSQKVDAEHLRPGDTSLGVRVTQITEMSGRQYMYDLTVADWHNFVLHTSGLLVSNCPDRNYHFRPPAHEETVQQFNRVFGFIWEDYELAEFLERGMDMVIAAPPRTPFNSVDSMVMERPEWRTLLLTGAMIWALRALMINWIADEFDYSIGGISLTVEKSSKYESALSSVSDGFDKQLEQAKMTVKVIKGLQQPKYGSGIRSSFGPYVGKGVLTPAKFMGFVIPMMLGFNWILDLLRPML